MNGLGKPLAMAFHDMRDMPAAMARALAFAGPGGRIATMADIVDARLASAIDDVAWSNHFTGLSTEFHGLSRGGVPVLAVLHGGGPMATPARLDGAHAATGVDGRDAGPRRGRVPAARFRAILDGAEGPVQVVDLREYLRLHEEPFGKITGAEAAADPLAAARLGGRDRADSFIARMLTENAALHARKGLHPSRKLDLVLKLTEDPDLHYAEDLGTADATSWVPRAPEDGMASAHLLTIGMAVPSSGGRGFGTDLMVEVGIHSWGDGCRFVGLRPGARPGDIHPGFSLTRAIATHDPDVWTMSDTEVPKLATLCRIGERTFTQVPKDGIGLDSHAPQFEVTHVERVGEPVRFEVRTAGHHTNFQYATEDVAAFAPRGANAYDIDELAVAGDARTQSATATFYRATIDGTRRVLTEPEVLADTDLMLALSGA